MENQPLISAKRPRYLVGRINGHLKQLESPHPMKHLLAITTTCVLLCLSTPPVLADGAGIEWDVLNDEVEKLYRTGQYDRGVVVAKKALEVAEQNVGPDHPGVATSLNNLAGLYHAMGRDDEAEPLEQRVTRIEAIER